MFYVCQRRTKEKLRMRKVMFYTCISRISPGNILAVVTSSIQVVRGRTGIQNDENTILWISVIPISKKLYNKIKQLYQVYQKTSFQYLKFSISSKVCCIKLNSFEVSNEFK